VKEAELKAYEEELEEAKRVKALFARKEETEREEREALEKLRAQKLARERAAQQAKRAEEEAEEMRRQYAAMEQVTVTDDGAKKETVMVTPTAPMITVTSEEGLSHSYPQRSFKPEQPKGPETVTLKASGETGGAVDHTLFACVGLALMGSVALVTVSKSWLRSPVAAPEQHIELLSKSGGYADLEDGQESILANAEPSWASSAVERALLAAEAK
jgi:ATPase subunit of ABC transporter with duplicated ATPase domains